MNYKDYLKTEYWQNIRKEKLKRRIIKKDKGCQICGEKDCRFNIHHAKYKDKNGNSVLFNENARFLVVLCEDCHHLYHLVFGNKYSEGRKSKIVNLIKLGITKETAFHMVKQNKYHKIKKLILEKSGKRFFSELL